MSQEKMPETVISYEQWIGKRTVPIFAQGPETGDLSLRNGTGVLFSVADDYFILTAAHVIDLMEQEPCKLFVPLIGKATPVELEGSFVVVTNPPGVPPEPKEFTDAGYRKASVAHREIDRLDVVAIRLTEEQAMKLKLCYEFVRMTNVLVDRPSSRRDVCVYGHPSVSTRLDVRSMEMSFTPLVLNTGLADGGSLAGWDEEKQIAVGYNSPEPLPDPEGLSGCGIWALPHIEDRRVAGEPNPSLIGIEWGAYGNKILRGTKMGVILYMISETIPELKIPIEIGCSF